MRRLRGFGRVRGILTLAVLGVVVATAACTPPPPPGPTPDTYVALGDSFTSGPIIPVQQLDPLGCLRSDHNYPHLVDASLGLSGFRDVSCSGAKTANMTQAQDVTPGPPNPPQLDALDTATAIVTLQIGGNDIGFTSIGFGCATVLPLGTPCQDRYVVNGVDEISRRITETGQEVAAVLQAIHDRAPNARVLVVNYLPILPEANAYNIASFTQLPFAPDDVPYLRAKQYELNGMLAQQAAANDAELVDAYSAGIGHDACQLPLVRFVEPLVPLSPAAPVHPNLFGMQATAAAVLAAIN
jgi:lysophospholipase L1-like esterase